MLDDVRNIKTSELELVRPLPEAERVWLVDQLCAKRCVSAVLCDSRALVVEYDADLWRSADLLDFLADCRVAVVATREVREGIIELYGPHSRGVG